ncbi:T9SS type A sorting domain-containing protein [Bacteroidota bacterium]
MKNKINMSILRYFFITSILLLMHGFSTANKSNDLINKNECIKTYKHEIINNTQELIVIDSISIGRDHLHDLTWDGTNLWIILSSPVYEDSIFKIDPVNGNILDSFKIPTLWASQGLAWDADSPGGPYLWCSDDVKDENPGKIYKIRIRDFSIIDIFNPPDRYPYGLAWDGTILWIFGSYTNSIFTLNPETRDYKFLYKLISTSCRMAISENKNGSSYLWISNIDIIGQEDYIIIVDSKTGEILQTYYAPGPIPTGITWDKDSPGGPYLWVSDFGTNLIYKIKAPVISDVIEQNENQKNISIIETSPNPFPETTAIKFNLEAPDYINLTVYNTLGFKVSVLADDFLDSCNHEFTFDGSNLPSGTYYFVFKAGSRIETGKLIHIR